MFTFCYKQNFCALLFLLVHLRPVCKHLTFNTFAPVALLCSSLFLGRLKKKKYLLSLLSLFVLARAQISLLRPPKSGAQHRRDAHPPTRSREGARAVRTSRKVRRGFNNLLNNQTHLTYAIAWEWVLFFFFFLFLFFFFFFFLGGMKAYTFQHFLSFTTRITKQAAYLQSPRDVVLLRIELPYAYSMPVRKEKVFFLCELYFTVAYCIPFRLWIRRYDLMETDWLDRK